MSILSGLTEILFGKVKPEIPAVVAVAAPKSYPPPHWLRDEYTIEKIEALIASGVEVTDESQPENFTAMIVMPSSDEWSLLKAQYLAGDRFWTFCSPGSYWSGNAGRSGWALVRGGNSIAHIETMFN